MSGADRERLLGLIALINAIEMADRLAIEKACLRLHESDHPTVAAIVRIALRFKGSPEKEISRVVSEGLRDAKLVLWWNGKRFSPALYCEDIATALNVRAMLGFLGGKSLNVCPHCAEPFMRTRSDMEYCSVKHREAHRVARWRAGNMSRSKKRSSVAGGATGKPSVRQNHAKDGNGKRSRT